MQLWGMSIRHRKTQLTPFPFCLRYGNTLRHAKLAKDIAKTLIHSSVITFNVLNY